jgi:hypothetical protein
MKNSEMFSTRSVITLVLIFLGTLWILGTPLGRLIIVMLTPTP